ncbi:MAG: DUF4198 domain-containing protein [Desulfobacteraceae bacterium]|nr:DUF4198 domain-containing protein [Desulfobacteraceae bacterium]
MKKAIGAIFAALLVLVTSVTASAHFGMIISSDTMVMQADDKQISLKLSFSHPFENIGMDMSKPRVFAVLVNGKKTDLVNQLKPSSVMGNTAWESTYRIQRPGLFVFYMEPEPYWEPAEDCFIIHFTKTIVTAFGDDEGWDKAAGLKTEIVPLSKPYGLYAGNVFQGIVKLDGKPVPFAEVEVEYFNEDGKSQAPTAYMIAQTIKADPNGVITYAVPSAGWWGFAALNEADFTIRKDGVEKPVELGAVLWVKFHPWQ